MAKTLGFIGTGGMGSGTAPAAEQRGPDDKDKTFDPDEIPF